MTTTKDDRPRSKKSQAVLTVRGKQQLSEHLVRLVLGGDGVSDLRYNDHTDRYVKLLIPQPGGDLLPPYDMDRLRKENPESMPSKRTYTVRRWDTEANEIWIDFVIHKQPGQTGIASDWADAAWPGDQIAMMGAGGGYSPRDDAPFHLLIGDLAALPAIAAALEAMAPTARGHTFIHVEHAADRLLDLSHPAGVEVTWVVGQRSDLLEAVRVFDLPASLIEEGGVQVFCHAERALTKELRRYLVKDLGIAKRDISISAYWALGRIEDQFQAEKREPIGQIDPDEDADAAPAGGAGA
ncbi:MAG: siderophore-interacting protein [Dermabacter sp.]|nr:siderophore-interacting protein [Dermabacter sp.]